MKSIYRRLMNEALKEPLEHMNGRVLDLASGNAPSYHRYLAHPGIEIVCSDREAKGVQPIDFDNPLPYRDSEFDAVLCVNALYIAKDPVATLVEARRVMKDSAQLLLVAPFVFAEAREPHDYWRWTSEGYERLLKQAGFSAAEITTFGGHFTSALYIIEPFLYFRFIRWTAHGLARFLDRRIPEHYRRLRPCPLGYLVTARK